MTHELTQLSHIVFSAGQNALLHKEGRIVEFKSDGSHVTNVDRETEIRLKSELLPAWNGTTCWGEEFGYEEMGANGLWLIDPIDGTTNFSHGLPLWGISVALMDQQGLRLGVIALPELSVMLCAERGKGAFWNGKPMPPIPEGEIMASSLVSVNERIKSPVPGKPRLCGAFVVDGAFTVKQYYRALFGINEKLYDVAASILAARELGAKIAFLDGEEFDEMDWVRDIKIDRPWGIFPANSQLF